MEIQVALIVLLAALFHATWNAVVKSGVDHLLSITGLAVAMGIIGLFILPIVGFPHRDSWIYLFASAVLHFGYFIALSETYRLSDFSQAYPIARGTAPIIVTLWGFFFLSESMSLIEIISLLGVISGTLIFATRKFEHVANDRSALIAALLTSCTIGGYTIADGLGGRASNNVLGYMMVLHIMDGIPILIYTWFKRGNQGMTLMCREWKPLFAGAALALVSYTLVVWAMTQAPIPLVSALRETSIVIAALIGTYFFKEPSGKRRILASIVIFLSVALLAFKN
jgi:drug/metabolite transporter (DMT)-like permease